MRGRIISLRIARVEYSKITVTAIIAKCMFLIFLKAVSLAGENASYNW